jgi:hypothetical protein
MLRSVFLFGFALMFCTAPTGYGGELAALPPELRAIADQVEAAHPELLDSEIVRALAYYDANPELVRNRDYLTVIDFSQPSTAERMYVIDMRTAHVETYLVAHGKNSGENYATRFSNVLGSNMSSLGIYLTAGEYIGSHGRSMYLKGMEPTNSNALDRGIVLHSASYVSYDFIRQYGRLGRSEGCPAVEERFSDQIITEIEGGSVLSIYH